MRRKNCLCRPCLLMDRDEMSNLYRGPSIDASYQVTVHLTEGFQRRRLKCEKLTDDKWWQNLTLPLARWAKNWTCHTLSTLNFTLDMIIAHRNHLINKLKDTNKVHDNKCMTSYHFSKMLKGGQDKRHRTTNILQNLV